jgi:hypothetical protein
MRIKLISFIMLLFFLSCEEQEVEDCAGVLGGNAVCGCTDSQATNYDSDATFDDESCEYDGTLDCAGVLDGDNICGCMDETAINYNDQATFDDGTCQYYTGELNVVWSKEIDEAAEMWSLRPVSDGGFIMACGGAGDCVDGTYDDPCEFYGQLVRLDANGDLIWHKEYETSSAIYAARETSDGGFIAAGWYECLDRMDCYPDMFILKTDADGNEEWSRVDASSDNNNDWARDAIQTQDGNFVVGGTWNDDGWNSKAGLRKYDTNGELLWAKNHSSSTANEIYELIETDEGDIVFAGYAGTQHGFYQHFMVKTNADGDPIWKKKKRSVGDAILYALCEGQNGGYVGAGFCNSWRSNFVIQRNPNQGSGNWNNCIIGEQSVGGFYDITASADGGYYAIDDRSNLTKLDAEGQVVFTEHVGANLAVIELSNGDIVVAGSGAFLEGGYGGFPTITRLSFSNTVTAQ